MSSSEPTEKVRLAGRMAGQRLPQRLSPPSLEAPPPPPRPVLPAIRLDGLVTPAPQRPFGLLWVVLITILALFVGLLIQLPASVVEVLSNDDAVAFYVSPEWLERIGFTTAIVLYAAAFVGLPLFFLRRRRSQDLIRWRRPQRADIVWAVAAAGVSWGALLLYHLIAGELAPDILRPDPIIRFPGLQLSNEWLAFYAFLTVIAAPLGEEAFFRGFLLGGLRRARSGAWGRRIALLVVTALFAAAHFYVPAMIPIAVSGLLFGLLFIRTGNLTAPTLAHFGHNAVGFIVALWIWGVI